MSLLIILSLPTFAAFVIIAVRLTLDTMRGERWTERKAPKPEVVWSQPQTNSQPVFAAITTRG